jgi:predicted RND superfamily exporter protein
MLSLHRPDLLVEEKTVTDKEVLMEILEFREEIEDTEDVQELFKIYQQTSARKSLLVADLKVAFEKEAYEEVSELISTLSYFYSMNKELLGRIPGDVFSAHGVCPVL